MIGFAGLSHLGIVSSIATASKGWDVVAYDPDASLCEGLAEGRLPLSEPGLGELLAANRSRLRFSADPADLGDCQVLYFSSDIPTDEDGLSDLSPLRRLIGDGLAHASRGATVVVLSQVQPGFTRGLADGLSAQGSRDLQVCYQAETLVFGQAVERALHPQRLILGCADPMVPLPDAYALLLDAFDCPILTMGYESAELAKISINVFLASSVSVSNTMAELCEAIGADWDEIVPALRMGRRIGAHAYLSPGLGLSGGNLERDLATVTALAAQHGTDAAVVEAWGSNSRHRRDWVLRTIHSEVIRNRDDPVIAMLGLAYKPDTDSTKNSPAIALLEHLKPFRVRVYDPVVSASVAPNPRCHGAETELEACEGADVLAVMTPWPQFAKLDPREVAKRMRDRVVLDPYGVLKADACREAGLSYHTLGAPAR